MKNRMIQFLAFFLILPLLSFSQNNTDSTGFAGDHFSLEGALEMFKKSNNPEEFEKYLNEEDNYVNNLDLNEDGQIDYIKVFDNMEGDIHAIVLQADVNKEESQDIAVILLEKTGPEKAVLQIVGDEDVYGEEKIVEPYASSMDAGGKGMPLESYGAIRITVNVWSWPGVRYIYRPTYVVYRSPWYWMHYPKWWKPWKPHTFRWHYSKRTVYHVHYKPYSKHRVVRAHNFYKPNRKSSVTVRTKTVTTRTVVKRNSKGPTVKKTTINTEKTISKKNNRGKFEVKTKNKNSKTKVSNKQGTKVTKEKRKVKKQKAK